MTIATIPAQIAAILGSNTFRWATQRLGGSDALDDVRFRDLITVTEDDVYDAVLANGFDTRVVAEGDYAEDHLCIAPTTDDRWLVCYVERGQKSEEVVVDSLDAARREVIRRLMISARISLNHRFKLAHPELDLPLPSEMD